MPSHNTDELTLLTEIFDLKDRLDTLRMDARENQLTSQAEESGMTFNSQHVSLYTVHQLRAQSSKILDVSWTPSDRFILTVGSDSCVIIWDAQSGLINNMMEMPEVQPVTATAVANGDHIFAGGLCGTVVLYRSKHRPAEDGYSLYENKEVYEHSGQISNIVCINDSKLLTSAQSDGALLWDVDKVKIVKQFVHPETEVQSLCQVEPELPTFITATIDGAVRLWDIRIGTDCVRLFEGHQADVNCVRMLPSAINFVTGSEDAFVHLYDLRTDAVIERYSEPVQASPTMHSNHQHRHDTRPSASIGVDTDSMRFSFNEAASPDDHSRVSAGVSDIAVSSSGRILMTGCKDSIVYFWDLAYASNSLTHQVESGPVMRLAMSNKKTGLVMVTWDSKSRVRLMRPR